ncbi:MAG TPA: hypothetical protein VN963_02600 [bacterium]|nr:hypothetical protein [bacterium]
MLRTNETHDPTNEWIKKSQTGWIEKQEKEKIVATLRAHYQTINPPEDKKISEHEYYSQTAEKDFVKKAQEATFYKAIYKDIFKSNLSLLTQSMTTSGVLMEIMLHFPNYQSELIFLAKVTSVETDNELGRDVYHAHLQAIAVNQNSLAKMMHAIRDQKSNNSRQRGLHST